MSNNKLQSQIFLGLTTGIPSAAGGALIASSTGLVGTVVGAIAGAVVGVTAGSLGRWLGTTARPEQSARPAFESLRMLRVNVQTEEY